MRIKYLPSLLLMALCLGCFYSTAQCSLNYDVKVEPSTEKENASKIILTLKEVTTSVQLKLYDIMDPRFPLIMDREVPPGRQSKTIEFTQLKNSTYSIMATWKNCTENIGGIKGIRIDKTPEK
jgi:hypothetical protein